MGLKLIEILAIAFFGPLINRHIEKKRFKKDRQDHLQVGIATLLKEMARDLDIKISELDIMHRVYA